MSVPKSKNYRSDAEETIRGLGIRGIEALNAGDDYAQAVAAAESEAAQRFNMAALAAAKEAAEAALTAYGEMLTAVMQEKWSQSYVTMPPGFVRLEGRIEAAHATYLAGAIERQCKSGPQGKLYRRLIRCRDDSRGLVTAAYATGRVETLFNNAIARTEPECRDDFAELLDQYGQP
jgi:hypothetical protein